MLIKKRFAAFVSCLLFAVALFAPFASPRQALADEIDTVAIDPSVALQSDFLGVGVDIIPEALMQRSLEHGYTAAHWEMDRKRILGMRPKVARVWFQVDWMETTKGNYDWSSPKMLAFYKYLDVLQSAGTEVELNFGWKNGQTIHSWYGLSGVDPYISAPADLNDFAASVSAALGELIQSRGYTNIKYLTFYNEPNGSWDFEAPGDQKAYYAAMVEAVHDKLTANGRRSLVGIWGPEETNASWTQYMKDHIGTIMDGYSFHVYGESYDGLSAAISARKSVVSPKPVLLTEFGWSGDDLSGWNSGYANTVIKAANEGVKGALVWQMNGVYTTDPDGDTSGGYDLWDSLARGLTPKKAYYAAGMLARYIPAHSTVVAVDPGSPNLRAAAFKTSGGDYTIVLESKAGTAKNVTFSFNGTSIGKTFYKHVYRDSIARDGQAELPRTTATFAAGTSFRDPNVDSDYSVIVYTTLPPQTQVEVTPLQPTVVSGGAVQLSSYVVDHAGGVAWSVAGSGNGSVSSTGLYTAPSVASEKLVAVKATSVGDPSAFGVALIQVLPSSAFPAPANAGFESPVTANAAWGPMTEGWTFNSLAGVLHNGNTTGSAAAPEGAQIGYLKTLNGQQGQINQSIELPAGTYRVNLKAAQRIGYGGVQTFDALSDGIVIGSFEPASGSFADYATGSFTVAEGSHTIAFAATTTTGDNTAFLDAISIQPMNQTPPAFANDGFESPSTTSAAVGPMTAGWTFNLMAGIQHNGSASAAAPAPEGVQTAYLKTLNGAQGAFSQTLSLPAGAYRVHFKAAHRASFGGYQTFNVLCDGAVIGSFAPTSGSFVDFETSSVALSAGSHTFQFAATTTVGDNTAFIDRVTISAL